MTHPSERRTPRRYRVRTGLQMPVGIVNMIEVIGSDEDGSLVRSAPYRGRGEAFDNRETVIEWLALPLIVLTRAAIRRGSWMTKRPGERDRLRVHGHRLPRRDMPLDHGLRPVIHDRLRDAAEIPERPDMQPKNVARSVRPV